MSESENVRSALIYPLLIDSWSECQLDCCYCPQVLEFY